MECSIGPLVTPEKVFQKFLRYFSGHLSFIKETKKMRKDFKIPAYEKKGGEEKRQLLKIKF